MTDFVQHLLEDGLSFFVGRLPDSLVWDDDTFEAVWMLHPHDRHQIVMWGRPITVARWQQAYGADYQYSGNTNVALPIPAELRPLLNWAQNAVDVRLNGLLLNWYGQPGDYIGPHHDSTQGLVPGTPIVTISFGETRMWRLERGAGSERRVLDLAAAHGSVFLLPYDTNHVWKHSVPKRAAHRGRRISVTLRAFSVGVLPEDRYYE
jgi:alkylated DNA repair dioxygenase AlkB